MTEIILLNHESRELKVIEAFPDTTLAHDYCIEFIEKYIQDHQGKRAFEYIPERPMNLKYGFYVKPSNSILFKWTIVEILRTVGYLYNSHEEKKHLTISIAIDEKMKTDCESSSSEDHIFISPEALELYEDVVEILQKRFDALHSSESCDESSSE